MSSTPFISVLLPVYNTERYVAEAVESILAQTFTDFEFLIIDDGSTDRSRTILERYAAADSRIRFRSRPNTGYVVALNEMLSRARGEFIARMDADDVAMPERFERQVRFLEQNPDHVLVGSQVLVIDPEGAPLTIMGTLTSHEDIEQAFLAARGQMIYHPAVMMRKQAVLDIGGYNPNSYTAEDLELFLCLTEIGRIANLPEPLLKYREHLNKIGYTRMVEQRETIRRILLEAHRRRNLPPPNGSESHAFKRPSRGERHRTWAWWALASGNVATARKHAQATLLRMPLSIESWKLLYCAFHKADVGVEGAADTVVRPKEGPLPLPRRLLASALRRMPTRIRKVGSIWNPLYSRIVGGQVRRRRTDR